LTQCNPQNTLLELSVDKGTYALRRTPFTQTSIDTAARELGQRINAYRISRQLTTEQLANEMGVSRPTLSRLTDGENTSLATLLRALVALDLESNLDLLVPDVSNSPIAQIKGGKSLGQRQRVRPSPDKLNDPWTWGDAE
jgi:transcriptional regulator with XRE-family HTH domain